LPRQYFKLIFHSRIWATLAVKERTGFIIRPGSGSSDKIHLSSETAAVLVENPITLYAFFVVSHANREVLHVEVTRHLTAEWVAQQIVECCGRERSPPRFLIHDRVSRYGALFDRRLKNLGITQVRTPFGVPQANSIAERWVRSARQECLDHTYVFGEGHLRRVLAEYVAYLNQWRPHRSIGQRAPCAPALTAPGHQSGTVVATPVLGGLHHVYQIAA